jgi:threonine dehydratase
MVLCGGNIDTRVLSSVLLRGLARDGRLLRLEVDIADRPGALAEVARRIGESGGNIVEIEHQRIFTEKSAKNVVIETTVEVIERKHGEKLIAALNGAGFPTRPV